MPGRHVRRVRRPVGAGTEEPFVVFRVDVMGLHHPHEMHRISAAGKSAVIWFFYLGPAAPAMCLKLLKTPLFLPVSKPSVPQGGARSPLLKISRYGVRRQQD